MRRRDVLATAVLGDVLFKDSADVVAQSSSVLASSVRTAAQQRKREADGKRLGEDSRRGCLRRVGIHAVCSCQSWKWWIGGFWGRRTLPNNDDADGFARWQLSELSDARQLLHHVCRVVSPVGLHLNVLAQVLALTKLNFKLMPVILNVQSDNACIYGDGEPVTLKFADAVGEILTAGPVSGAPLPFRLYI